MGVESYKHQFAKQVLVDWLRSTETRDGYVGINPVVCRSNRNGPFFGVWSEYPVCLNDKNDLVGVDTVWDEIDWDENSFRGELGWWNTATPAISRPPTYDECVKFGLLPIVIFDVAIQHKGFLAAAIEIVHRNDISASKMDYLRRIQSVNRAQIYRISADWILSQVRRPDLLKVERVL